MNKGAKRLYNKLKSKNFIPRNICEVGVFLPQESNVLGFVKDHIPTTFIEADPDYVIKIKDFFRNYQNTTVIEAAVFDFNGTIELCKRASSTFISQLVSSPAIVNDKYSIKKEDIFEAKSILFSEVDNGNYDLISIDIEGAEWYVLKHMKSSPTVISIETHGKYYTNPHMQDIQNWMDNNDYVLWYKDKSDSVYVKNGIFNVNIFEKIQLVLNSLSLMLTKLKGLLKNLIGFQTQSK